MEAVRIAAERGIVLPKRSFSNGHVVHYEEVCEGRLLSKADRAAHVVSYSAASGSRMPWTVAVVEEAIAKDDRRVIVISTNRRWFGLSANREGSSFSSSRPFVLFGRDIHGLELQTDDVEDLIPMIVDGQENLIVDVRHLLDRASLSSIVQRIVQAINVSELEGVTIVLDVFQVIAPRVRHGFDSGAISAMLSLADGGYDRDIELIATATSPNEIPREFRNGLATRALGICPSHTQIQAIDAMTDCGIAKHAYIEGMGISMAGEGYVFVIPGSKGHPDRMLLSVIPEPGTQAGTRYLPEGEPTAAQKTAIAAVVKGRASRVKNDTSSTTNRSTPASRKTQNATAKKRAANYGRPRAAFFGAVKGEADPTETLKGNRVEYASFTAGITRLVLSYEQCGSIDYSLTFGHDQIVDRVLSDRGLRDSARWAATNARDAIISRNVTGCIHYRIGGAEGGVEFLEQILRGSSNDPSMTILRTRLTNIANDFGATANQLRFALIDAAWASRAGGASQAPTAANDDVAIAQAI